MKEKFLKARLPAPLYQALQVQAGEAGLRLGTLVREILERNAQVVSTTEALARIEAALAATTAASTPARDHDLHREVRELRLIVRELAMNANAQILTRVAAQLAAQAGAP
ncbi:MAG: hypothetical protein ACREO8_08555 [Luteimonas sp.]